MASQSQRVIKMLKEQGFVSRNYYINLPYDKITRLGAVIFNLKQKGWEIETEETNNDTIYRAKPLRVEQYYVNYPEGRKLFTKKIYEKTS